jgi:DNA-binding transcriptional ArsR family regulator
MNKASGRSNAKKDAGKAGDARGCQPYEEDDLIRALNQRLRRQILRVLHSSKGPLSPAQILEILEFGDKKLSTVSYHVRVLADFKAISLVEERQVRGAMEHFYIPIAPDRGWVRGLLKTTKQSDEAHLWHEGKSKSDQRASGKKRR